MAGTQQRSNLPTTVGSKSTKTARGTCLPAPVSLKKVLKESSPPPMVLSEGICPSGWIPCSRQYNSQQALPICTPACPTCTEIHSRCRQKEIIIITYILYIYIYNLVQLQTFKKKTAQNANSPFLNIGSQTLTD